MSKVVAGGAAEASGNVHVGDTLEEVDGVKVGGIALETLARDHVLGPPGSAVTLVLASPGGGRKTVTLRRR